MRIRTSVQVALIVGACTVLAPLYGPSIRARAATPQDDLDKSFKALAGAYSLLEQNYADPISSEKAIYQGAIPGMLRTLDPHSNFLDPERIPGHAAQTARPVFRHRHADFDGRHQGDRHGALPRFAGVEGRPAPRRCDHRGGWQGRHEEGFGGRGRYAARAARQSGARHGDARRRDRTRDGDGDPRRDRDQPGGCVLAEARHRLPEGDQL